jgi:D-glycero-D-manno-heptose 1,7-bisphosphate phosphatase
MLLARQQSRSAVFLDRDGTIIEDHGYLRAPAGAVFLPGARQALSRLGEAYLLFIVTNQPGVAEGVLRHCEVEQVNAHVVKQLRAAGALITATYYCPHGTDDDCGCRKPKPFFLHQAAEQYGVCLEKSFVIGDHPSDVESARNAGAMGIYVLTGHGTRHLPNLPTDCLVKADLAAAVEWILRRG